jgi:hypothetical protein
VASEETGHSWFGLVFCLLDTFVVTVIPFVLFL